MFHFHSNWKPTFSYKSISQMLLDSSANFILRESFLLYGTSGMWFCYPVQPTERGGCLQHLTGTLASCAVLWV